MLHSLFSSGSDVIGKMLLSKSTTVEDVITREDLSPYLQSQRENGKGETPLVAFVECHIPELVRAALRSPGEGEGDSALPEEGDNMANGDSNDDAGKNAQQPQELRNENATELITFLIDAAEESEDCIRCIAMQTFSILRNRNPIIPLVSQCFQRILLDAFEINPVTTAEAIAATLNEDMVFGIIHHIATNFIISETIVALFGTVFHMDGVFYSTIPTQVSTEAWITYHFPQKLASLMSVALRSESHQPYFYFWKEFIHRGSNYTAGPIVDELLKYELISEYVKDILVGCEEARIDQSAVPLAAQGVEVLHCIIAMVRATVIPPDAKEMYFMNVLLIAPIKCIKMHAVSFSNLMFFHETVSSSRISSMQSALCEMFAEVLRFHLRDTDSIIKESFFLEKLVMISGAYPDCYRLTSLLQQTIMSIFSDDTTTMDDNNIILQHIITIDTPLRQGFLSECVSFCTKETLRHTPLSALMMDTWRTLATKKLFEEPNGPLRHVVKPLLTNQYLQKRIQDMERPISGEGFASVGSGCQDKIQHHPTINHFVDQNSDNNNSNNNNNYTDPLPSQTVSARSSSRAELPNRDAAAKNPYLVAEETGKSSGNGAEATAPDDELIIDTTFLLPEALLCEGDDTVTVDLKCADEAMIMGPSPQVQAYPRFVDIHMSFEKREEGNSDMSSENDSGIFRRRFISDSFETDNLWIHGGVRRPRR